MNTPAREILQCLFIIGLMFTSCKLSAQNSVGIGTNTPNTNSVLELISTGNNQGFLMPRMTTVQRTDASFTSGLTTTENGLMVFDTDEGAVYFWFSGLWVNTTTLLAGTGIDVTGTVITNTGDTDASDDLTTSSVAAGDITGDFANLNVEGIQGQPVSNTVPTLDYVLKWDGSQWLPQPDAGNVYTAGTGIDVTGTVITNTGDTDASDDLTISSTAAGDVSGDFSTLQVTGIQGNPIVTGTPVSGDILKWDGSQWQLSNDDDSQDALSVPFDDAVAVLGVADVQAAIEALDAAIDGLGAGDMTQATYDTDVNGIVDFAEDANTINGGLTVESAVPVGAVFTDNQDATSTSFDDAAASLGVTDVQAAIEALDVTVDGLGTPGDMFQATYDVGVDGIVDNTELVNGLTVETAVPVGAVFTDNQTATTVGVTPTGNLASTDVQSALLELQGDIDGATGDMVQATYDVGANGVVDDSELVNGFTVETAVPVGAVFTDNQTATAVGVTPTGNLASTDVQSALLELQGDIDGATGDMVQATYDVGADGVVDDSELVNGLTVETAVPVGAVFTDNELPPTAATGEILEWTGSSWAAAVLSVNPINIEAGSAVSGDVLSYDGLNWVPSVSSIDPVNIAPGSAVSGDFLSYDGLNWVPTVISVDPANIAPGSAVSGDVLSYDGLNWVPTVSSVDPVNIAPGSAVSGDFLSYDGLNWVPTVISVDPANIAPGSAVSGDVLSYDGLNWVPSVSSIDPVNIAPGSAVSGDVLSYDGLNWVPTVSSVDPANIAPGSAVSGDVLSYDGLSWVPQANGAHVTTNEIPRGNGSVQVSSNMYSDGTNIGFGQMTPLSTLHLGLDNHIISEGNDLILSDNIHLVGGTPTYTDNGRAIVMAISSTGGDIQIFDAPIGTASTTATLNNLLTINGTGLLSNGSIQAAEGVTVAGNGSNATNLTLGDADNSASMIFKAPDIMSASTTTFTLPDGDGGSGTVLSTDGAGNLSWANNASFNTAFSIPKGDGVGLTNSDIYSSVTNEISIGSATPMTGVKLAVINEAGTPLYFGASNYSNNTNDGANLGLLRSRGTQGAEATLQNGDVIGGIGFNVWDGSTTHITAASIQATATSNHTFSSDYGTQLSISTTADGQGVDSERIRIQNDGSIVLFDNTSVGNGPTSAVKLQITPDAGQNNAFRINPETGGTNTGEFQLMELAVNGTNFVGLKAPDDIANTRVYTWPDADGTNGQMLTTDGAGIMSWTSPASFNTNFEIPRGDGAGLVSSNLFSNGTNVAVGLGAFTLPLNFSVVQEAGGTNSAGVLNYSSVAASDGSTLALIRARGNDAAPANVQNADRVGTVSFTSYSAGFNDAATIQVDAAENHDAGVLGSTFTIRTAALGETGNSDRFIIDENGDINTSGNIGIGIVPIYALDVTGDINVSGQMRTGGTVFLDVNSSTLTTSLGEQAGTGGQFNAFYGYQAGPSNTANQNAFFGYQSGQNNTSGAGNTFLGGQSGNLNTTGSDNTVIGFNAMRDNTTGVNNTIVGAQAGLLNTGSNNVYIGKDAGRFDSGVDHNVMVGSGAGTSNIGGSELTLIGEGTDVGASTLTNATAIGYNAVVNTNNSIVLGNGTANVGIGNSSPTGKLDVNFTIGQIFFTGSSNQQFGIFDVTNSGTGNAGMRFQGTGQSTTMGIDQTDGNKFKINMGTTFAGGETFTITPAGNVGILQTDPLFTLSINHDNAVASGGLSLQNSAGGENVSLFVNNTTSDLEFYANNGASLLGRILNSTGAYVQISDRRAKKNFESTGPVLSDINKVNITKYHYNKQDDSEIKQIGVVAQELKEVFPSLVSYDEQKDIYTVNYTGLAPITVKAIQELNALILGQKDEIEILKSQIASKDVQLDKLESDVSAIKQALGLDSKTSEK